MKALTLALPKGRLEEQVRDWLALHDIHFEFKDRKLVARDSRGLFEIFLVKNVDLPTYVQHGIAGLGVCGDDVLVESGQRFCELMELPFGGTRICLAAKRDLAAKIREHEDWVSALPGGTLQIATKFTKFTREHFHGLGIPVELIKLNGSVELAPVLGLAPFIVDLVETGSTLKANDLEVVQVLDETRVHFIANTAYYKLNYQRINALLEMLEGKGEQHAS